MHPTPLSGVLAFFYAHLARPRTWERRTALPEPQCRKWRREVKTIATPRRRRRPPPRVALRAARLDDRPRRPRRWPPGGRRRTGRTRPRPSPRRRARCPRRRPSRPRSAPSRPGSSARRRCRPCRGRAASTIAFERTCLHTLQANSSSPHSASVGLRSVTTCISSRVSGPTSRSWISIPPRTRLRSCSVTRRPAALGVLEDAHVLLALEHLQRVRRRSRARRPARRTSRSASRRAPCRPAG